MTDDDMASSEPLVLPPVAGCDNNGGMGAAAGEGGSVDVEFIDFDECSLEDRTNLCRILNVGGAPAADELGRHFNRICDFKLAQILVRLKCSRIKSE